MVQVFLGQLIEVVTDKTRGGYVCATVRPVVLYYVAYLVVIMRERKKGAS